MPTPPPGARKVTQDGSTFYVVGDERHPFRDIYHTFLQAPWWVSLALIAAGFFVANLLFAVIYIWVGGVGGARDNSFMDALSFSVQTMATIGYGVMHPESNGANTVMIVESMVGIIVTALATGLVFQKFSRPTTRIAFSKVCVITMFDNQRVLMFRLGNRRSNIIVEAQLHVSATKTTTTAEGELFYKVWDLPLVRDRQVGMRRGWTVMHVIDDKSPLFGLDQETLKTQEVEIAVALTGIDDISMQAVHTMHQYVEGEIRVGERFVDTLTLNDDGTYTLDITKFHTTVPDATSRAAA